MKIYCGRNRKGTWKASLNKSKLYKFGDIFECEVETIHNDKVYMIKTYYGFNYNFNSMKNPISDVVEYVYQLYHSVSAAKKNDIWKKRERLAKESPEKYHVTPFYIASDSFGKPFMYGDVMEGNFNMEIIVVKVI